MSNLRLINETTIPTLTANVSITDVFSSDFDIYKIFINDITGDISDASDLSLGLINPAGSQIKTDYDVADTQLRTHTDFYENRLQNTNDIDDITFYDDTPRGGSAVVYILNPFSSSSYSFFIFQGSAMIDSYFRATKGIGVLKQTASMSGFYLQAGNSGVRTMSGTVKTYGLRVDS
tara:strand:+ start:208 stop:735 length:528 start_codon:yes stop_codon:yes gene_type:complete